MEENKSKQNKILVAFQFVFDRERKISKYLIFILLGIFTIVGLFLLNDYGSPWDEYEEITIFIGNIKEYARLFFGENCKFNRLANWIDFATDNPNIDHGESVYYLLIPFSELFLNGNELLFVRLWRTNVLLVFLTGAYLLYLIVRYFTSDYRYGLLAVLMLMLSPRFFAEGMYNHKDIAQFTLWLGMFWFTILWMNQQKYKWAVLLGIVAAFAVNMRFAAVMGYLVCGIIYCVKLFKQKENMGRGILQGLVSITIFFLIFFLITPASWNNLFSYIWYCVTQASSFPWNGEVFFNGMLYAPKELTRFYLPVMIALTIPVLFIPLFFCGNFFTIFGRKSIGKDQSKIICRLNFDSIFLLMITYFPLLAYLIMHPVIYNGWRHYYFLYGFIIIWAILGIQSFLRLKKRALTRTVCALMAVQLLSMACIIGIGHPYQYSYYNILAGIHPENRYETDYWGVSGKQILLELIKEEYCGKPLKITGAEPNCQSILAHGVFILSDQYSDCIEIVEERQAAEYIFVNFTYCNELRNKDLWDSLTSCEQICVVNYLSTPLTAIYRVC